MRRPMDDFLSRVNSAEPDAGEWAAIDGRVRETLANPMPADMQRAEAAAQSLPAVRAAASPSGASSLWAGGIAAGLVVAGVAFFGLRGTSPQTGAVEFVNGEQQGTTAAIEVAERGGPAAREAAHGVSVPANELAHPTQRATSVVESTPSAVRTSAKRLRKSDEAAHEVSSLAVGASSERSQAESSTQVPLGESDVEYDRRHLVPIDAALQAHQPQTALKLLAAFRPKKLTNYAAGLRAIALCDAGQRTQGKPLAERTLPQLGHRGLARRVEVACGVKAPSETKP